MIRVGLHLVVELYGCKREDISTLEVYKEKIERVVNKSGVTVLSSYHHQFNPHGVTSIFLLAESHFTVHTWPEYNYMAVDIFTCGSTEKAWQVLECLKEEFKPVKVKVIDIIRGIPYEEVQRVSAPIPE
ncbi:MAG: adenosylmethionine decarboxylase [Candidatus Hydrothermarchaeota archaeon]|nr:MAG: adenosylmethionine decarboxylase [Candidatus Hydrothermarchaeota archaeon]